MCFNPSGDEDADVLAVACWNGTVCVHSMDIAGGKQARACAGARARACARSFGACAGD